MPRVILCMYFFSCAAMQQLTMRSELLNPSFSKTSFNFDHETINNCTSCKLLPILSIHALEKMVEQNGVDIIRHRSLIREAHSNMPSFSSQQHIDNAVDFICNQARFRDEYMCRHSRLVFSPSPPVYERRENGL